MQINLTLFNQLFINLNFKKLETSSKKIKVYLYIIKYIYDFINKEMLFIKKFQLFQLESFYLFLQKILIFFFCDIDRLHHKKVPFIQTLLKVCIFTITNIFLDKDNLLDIDKTPNIGNKMIIY